MKKYCAIFILLVSVICLNSCKQKESNSSEENTSSSTNSTTEAVFDKNAKFIGSFDMVMKMEEEVSFTTTIYSNGEKMATEMQMPENPSVKLRTITDPIANTMTTLEPSSKMAMVMKIPDVSNIDNEIEDQNIKVDKTNETKDIDGYNCRKYVVTSDNGVYEFWVTKEIKGNLYSLFSNIYKTKQSQFQKEWGSLDGFTLEAKLKDNKSPDKVVTMQMKNINTTKPDDKVFSTEGYTLQDMSKMGAQMQDIMKQKGK